MSIKSVKKEYKEKRRALNSDYGGRINELKREYKAALDEEKIKYKEALTAAYIEEGREPPKDPPRRGVLEEIGNSVTHGVGAVFAIVAIVLMMVFADEPMEYLGAAFYSFGLFVMFSMSCMYHAFPHGSVVKRIFRRFDYSSIYLLIGATFAPILLADIKWPLGIVFFIIQWSIIVTGITFIGVFGPTKLRKLHIPLYLILGWSGLMLLPEMFLNHGVWYITSILGGGAVYSLGIIPFVLKKGPSHFIWHFFVLAGAVVQWIGILAFIYLT